MLSGGCEPREKVEGGSQMACREEGGSDLQSSLQKPLNMAGNFATSLKQRIARKSLNRGNTISKKYNPLKMN